MICWTCLVCGLQGRVRDGTPKVCCGLCGFVQLAGARPGLGDRIAARLHRVGITPERWVKIKKALGLKPRCNCPERQMAINAFGKRVGL